MPKHKSAAKRMKTSEEDRLRNRRLKSTIRSASKMVSGEKDPRKIEEGRKMFARAVDKAAGKNVIHKNKAARLKSRLARSVKSK